MHIMLFVVKQAFKIRSSIQAAQFQLHSNDPRAVYDELHVSGLVRRHSFDIRHNCLEALNIIVFNAMIVAHHISKLSDRVLDNALMSHECLHFADNIFQHSCDGVCAPQKNARVELRCQASFASWPFASCRLEFHCIERWKRPYESLIVRGQQQNAATLIHYVQESKENETQFANLMHEEIL